MKQIILPSYTMRLLAISLMASFMVSAAAAESTHRHRYSPGDSSQQYQAGKKRITKNTMNRQPVRRGRRVDTADRGSAHRNTWSGNKGARNFRVDKTFDHRDIRRGHDEERITRENNHFNRYRYRRDRDAGWHERRESRYRYSHREFRNPGLLSIFFGRPYDYRHNRRYIPLTYRGHNYYYYNGGYYRYNGFGLTLVNGDVGIFLYSLPFGYRTLTIGGYPYYYANRHYYIRDHIRKVYVRVDDPYPAADRDDAENDSSSYEQLIVYPKQGQTKEQMKQDEYECYLWAVDQTGVDPGMGKPGNLQEYHRAKGACLEGRGYVVN